MPGEDGDALIRRVRPCPAIGAVAFVGFVRGTDLYIGEAQYTDLEYPAKAGWGTRP